MVEDSLGGRHILNGLINNFMVFRKQLFIILSILSFSVNAQKAWTYNIYDFSTSFSPNENRFHIAIGDMIEFRENFPLRFLVEVNAKTNFIKKNDFVVAIDGNYEKLSFNKTAFHSLISVPIGMEFKIKNWAIGGSYDILSVGLKNKLDSASYNLSANYTLKRPGISSVFSRKEKNNVSSKLYLAYTVNDTFTLKIGATNEHSAFKILKEDAHVGDFNIRDISPYFSFRINIEK